MISMLQTLLTSRFLTSRFAPYGKMIGSWKPSLVRPHAPVAMPFVWGRRWVYILPTFYGLVILGILQIILFTAMAHNLFPVLFFATVTTLMVSVAMVSTHRRLAHLQLNDAHIPPHPAHEPPTLILDLHHPTQQGYSLWLAWDTHQFLLPLSSPSQRHLLVHHRLKPRGIYPFSKSVLSTQQPFGVARCWAYLWPALEEVVYPTPEQNPPGLAGLGLEDEPHLWFQKGQEDIEQLRDYRQGDSLRDVAWKMSAKRERWVSKEYESPLPSGWYLKWELVSHLPYEHALSRLTAWLLQAEEQRQDYALVLPDFEQPLGHGPAHLFLALRHLAQLPPSPPWEGS